MKQLVVSHRRGAAIRRVLSGSGSDEVLSTGRRFGGDPRVPAGTERASSDFSRRTRAVTETATLLATLGQRRATVLWTYPEGERSNGLTVDDIREHADLFFEVTETRIPMRHSTLGGSETHVEGRLGRKDPHEALFRLDPKAPPSPTDAI